MKQSYLSIVISGRNDNYGGNFLQRLHLFINCINTLSREYRLDTEIILVEWNPPNNRPSLSKVIKVKRNSNLIIRIITVPNSIHRTYINNKKLPIFELIAKNAGVRRAKGKFILATNPDILFSFEIFKFISSKKLSDNFFYRTDRYDYQKEITLNNSLKDQINTAKKNCIRINSFGLSMDFDHKKLPFRLEDYLVKKEINKKITLEPNTQYRPEFIVHTNAAGDFLLMAKENWLCLRGYPEITKTMMVDAYLVCMAYSLGLKQKILSYPKVIFHQEHKRDIEKRPLVDYKEWMRDCVFMIFFKKPIIRNKSNWGLANINLKENYVF